MKQWLKKLCLELSKDNKKKDYAKSPIYKFFLKIFSLRISKMLNQKNNSEKKICERNFII